VSVAVAKLKQRVVDAEQKAEHYRSLLETFFTGDIPDNATFDHLILAAWGRRRLEELSAQPSLLRPLDSGVIRTYTSDTTTT
jgi:hypothetical protein